MQDLTPEHIKILSAKKRLQNEYLKQIGYCWKFGFAVDCSRLAYWAILLDNSFSYQLSQTFPAVESALIRSPGIEALGDFLHENQNVCAETIDFIEAQIGSIHPDKHKLQILDNLLGAVQLLHSHCFHGSFCENPEGSESIPREAYLTLRLTNPQHVYRWTQGKRYGEKGTLLAIVSQWIPDLEAMIAICNFIKVNQVPILEGTDPLEEIVPLGGKKPVRVRNLDDLIQAIVIPAKRLRRPAVQSECILKCIDMILSIDIESLARQDKKYLGLVKLMDQLQEEKLKEHIFQKPFRLNSPNLPDRGVFPEEFQKIRSQRYKQTEQTSEKSPDNFDAFNLIVDGLSAVSSVISKLHPEEIQKFYQEIRYSSEKKLLRLSQTLRNYNHKSLLTELKKIAFPSSTSENSETPPQFPENNENENRIKQKKRTNLLQQKQNTQLNFHLQIENPLDKLDSQIPVFNPQKSIDRDLLLQTIHCDCWKTNPNGYFTLIKRIYQSSARSTGLSIPDLSKIGALIQKCSQIQNKQSLLPLMNELSRMIHQFNSETIQELSALVEQLPDMQDALHEGFCTLEANKLIRNQKWDKLPKKDQQKLSLFANEKHVVEIAEKQMDRFLKQNKLSEQDIRRMSTMTIRLMDQLIHFLETAEIGTEPIRQKLLSQIKTINQRHASNLQEKLESFDKDFILECQTWLQTMCMFIHESDEGHYLNVIKNVENLFITVWKKVEENLLQSVQNQ